MLATVANTRRLAESGKKQEAGSIITKVTKQYIAKKGRDAIDVQIFQRMAAYANGGVPLGLDAKTLAKMFNATQVNPIRAIALAEEAGVGGQEIRAPPGGNPLAIVNVIRQVIREEFVVNAGEDVAPDDNLDVPPGDGH